MATEIKAFRSDMGRLFATEEEAIKDETDDERLKRLLHFFRDVRRCAYDNPDAISHFVLARRAELAGILTAESFSKETKK